MRTRKKKWTARELAENPRIVYSPETYKGRWHSFFGNSNPISLEIGCGKGKFIAQAANAFPDRNFIGLERDQTILAAAARLGLRVTEDARLAYIISDVEEMPTLFAPGEIQTLYIQFCDPWPNKKKWAKRRLTHSRFLRIYRELGVAAIFFKTDNRQLFEFSLEQFSQEGWLMKSISLDLHSSASSADETQFTTEYEEKFIALGQPIYRLEAYDRGGGGLKDANGSTGEIEEPAASNDLFSEDE
ncbi:MAG: tRNA (guanosine(46)-N7)-methyltransferase TrmB [Clostridiales bacterium]|nr:tRNA (guanosine(46)-N7)-methyltransferase TrmB [Clostridiales bacterium]